VGKKRKPPICDYCQGPTEFVDDSEVYERSYGRKVYLCRPCNAWVGVHKGTTRPLGRLAKSELRKMKIQAHAHLDVLWRAAMRTRGWGQNQARGKAYVWLAASMGIEQAKCHIGMFDEEQCRQVIALCVERKPAPTRTEDIVER